MAYDLECQERRGWLLGFMVRGLFVGRRERP
jgi:hypothetical protein